MPSILTMPPTAEPVALAEAKAHLRVGHADEDELISRLIVAARRHLEGQTGLVFITQGWSCFHDRWPEGPAVEIPVGPIQAVTALRIHGEDGEAAEIDPAHYVVDSASRPARLLRRGSRLWPEPGRIGNGIEIAVTAGFGASGDAVPAPIRQALLLLAAHWYGQRGDTAAAMPLTLATLIASLREKRL